MQTTRRGGSHQGARERMFVRGASPSVDAPGKHTVPDCPLTSTIVEVAPWRYIHEGGAHASDPRGLVGDPSRLTVPRAHHARIPVDGRPGRQRVVLLDADGRRLRRDRGSRRCGTPIPLASRRGRTHVEPHRVPLRVSATRPGRRTRPDRPAQACRRAPAKPPRRRQRHRGHPHTGAFPRQYELPGARQLRGALPVHRRHRVRRCRRQLDGRSHPTDQRCRPVEVQPGTAGHAAPGCGHLERVHRQYRGAHVGWSTIGGTASNRPRPAWRRQRM